ncbi:hypothetical protein PG990_011679 [Apiospora arundinis]
MTHCRWKSGTRNGASVIDKKTYVWRLPALPSSASTSPRFPRLSHTAAAAGSQGGVVLGGRSQRSLAPFLEIRLGRKAIRWADFDLLVDFRVLLRDTRWVDNLVGRACCVVWFSARKDDRYWD